MNFKMDALEMEQKIQNDEIRPIDEEFPGYFVSKEGDFYHKRKDGIWTKNTVRYGSDSNKSRYLYVSACSQVKGRSKELLLHRLVAKAYIPNPHNLPEVNHKDKNTHNPNGNNLEWCTRKDNLKDSYSTMSPTRNFNPCEVYKNGEKIGCFQSICEAKRYCHNAWGASESALERNLRSEDIVIIPQKNQESSFNLLLYRSPTTRMPEDEFPAEVC